MATSSYEKNLIKTFLKKKANKVLLALTSNVMRNKNLYNLGDFKFIDFESALQHAILSTFRNSRHLVTLDSCKVNNMQQNAPYVAVSKDGKHLINYNIYVYQNKEYKSLSEALKQAVVDMQQAENMKIDDLIGKFNNIIRNYRGSNNQVLSDQNGSTYMETGIDGLYVKKELSSDILDSINEKLGDNKISKITEEQFINFLKKKNIENFVIQKTGSSTYLQIKDTALWARVDNENEFINKLGNKLKITKNDENTDCIRTFLKRIVVCFFLFTRCM